jgi:SAM-dependent methyltransferase
MEPQVEGDITCSVCLNTSGNTLLFDVNGYKVYECPFCSHQFLSENSKSQLPIYEDSYFKGRFEGGYEETIERRKNDFREIAKILLFYLNKTADKTILEIGCASGGMLDVLKSEVGVNAEGLDISKYSSELARKKGHTVYCTHFLDYKAHKQDDVVLFTDSFEHFRDVRMVVEKTYEILNNEGLIAIVLPNHSSFSAKIYREYFKDYAPPYHLNFFTMRSICFLLRKYGFGILAIEFPYFESQWFNKEELQKLGRDLIDYDMGKTFDHNQPAFWGNVMMVIAVKK